MVCFVSKVAPHTQINLVSLPLSLPLYLSPSLFVCLSFCVSLSPLRSLSLPVSLSLHLSVCLSLTVSQGAGFQVGLDERSIFPPQMLSGVSSGMERTEDDEISLLERVRVRRREEEREGERERGREK